MISSQIFVLHENCPAKSPIFLRTSRWNPVAFDRLRWKTCLAFDYKKNHDDLNNTRSGNYGFVKHKNQENARKQRERTLSVRTLGPCGAATAKKKNLLHPSSFLLRRLPSNVPSVMPLHRLLIGLYDYQACSVGVKMDVYMHRRQESRSQSTVDNRSTEFEGDDVLAKEHCLYERDRRLRCEDEKTSQCKVRVVTFFLRSWQRRRRSEIGCYSARRGAAFHCISWEMFEHWRKNNRWVFWEFFVMKWPGLISLEKV